VVRVPDDPHPLDFPVWNFDGSSTEQASGDDSDCLLQPVRVVRDPLRGPGHHLVLCEVENPDGTPHASNGRAALRAVLDATDPGADRRGQRQLRGRPQSEERFSGLITSIDHVRGVAGR
jgi:glutamine synthetase